MGFHTGEYILTSQEGSEGGVISAQTRKRNKDIKTNYFHGENTKVGIPNSGGGAVKAPPPLNFRNLKGIHK